MFRLGMPHHSDHGRHDVSAADTSGQGFLGGSVMERVYTNYASLPVGREALQAAGWTKHNTECDEHLGYAWTQHSSGPTTRKPLILYTTADGLPAGVGTIIQNFMPEQQKKWVTKSPLVAAADSQNDAFQIDVAFRSSDVCTEGAGHSGIGDRLIVNPGGEDSMEVPLTYDDSWKLGSCYDGMGTHAFLNTNDPSSTMPWQTSDLFPIVPMYHEGEISAIFFASVTSQVTIPMIDANWWEPVTLDDAAMCTNACDEKCDFTGNEGKEEWSTMHIYFNDHTKIKCAPDLECLSEGSVFMPGKASCCPAKASKNHQPEGSQPDDKQPGSNEPNGVDWVVVGILSGILVALGVSGLFLYSSSRRLRAPAEVNEVGLTETSI